MRSVLSLLAFCSLVCSSAQALDMATLEREMASTDGPAADKERDASRQAPAVLNFLGVEAGMNVLDNDADDHSVGPFDPSSERNTDRIVLKSMKL